MTREERRKRRKRYMEGAKSPNTIKAYAAAWGKFGEWCEAEGIERANATPENIADFLCEMADEGQPNGKPFSRRTILLRRSALVYHYGEAGRKPNPAKDGVAPVSRTPFHWGNQGGVSWREERGGIRRSTASGWWNSRVPVVARGRWLGSSSPRSRRSATGSDRGSWTRESGETV